MILHSPVTYHDKLCARMQKQQLHWFSREPLSRHCSMSHDLRSCQFVSFRRGVCKFNPVLFGSRRECYRGRSGRSQQVSLALIDDDLLSGAHATHSQIQKSMKFVKGHSAHRTSVVSTPSEKPEICQKLRNKRTNKQTYGLHFFVCWRARGQLQKSVQNV